MTWSSTLDELLRVSLSAIGFRLVSCSWEMRCKYGNSRQENTKHCLLTFATKCLTLAMTLS